ncbi:MAG: hypothetical protein KIT87_17550 [Anaerolineae bacterium]|nr:hypothetical protein [Anaerolineae bacterium]
MIGPLSVGQRGQPPCCPTQHIHRSHDADDGQRLVRALVHLGHAQVGGRVER